LLEWRYTGCIDEVKSVVSPSPHSQQDKQEGKRIKRVSLPWLILRLDKNSKRPAYEFD
jgi:hypothetical protein